MNHGLELGRWYVNKDQTCYVKPLEELGPDGAALCVFVQTDHAHVSIYRNRRDAKLLLAQHYDIIEGATMHVPTQVSLLADSLMSAYKPRERGSFPFCMADKIKYTLKLFRKETHDADS